MILFSLVYTYVILKRNGATHESVRTYASCYSKIAFLSLAIRVGQIS